ncbi:MAG: CHC2 zinc finger domain-containing protein [Proteobacteria bacterium]|nr:CHC2 zinc finger domain-containing protein [Pseudomonadota bacterium]
MKDQYFPAFIDQVKELNDIVQVISTYIPLDHHFMAICPLHSDKKPSLRVYPNTQSFYCFGCHAGGDVINFIMLHQEIPFWNALTFLADKVGLTVPTPDQKDLTTIQQDRIIEDILIHTVQYYHSTLTPEVKEYLIKERMISEDIIERFLIGYAKGGLKRHLINTCKHSIEDCLKAGVLINDQNSGTRDFFYHRITLPSFKYGRAINISGRIFPEGDPKYINLPGRPIDLYNQDSLRSKKVIITEGIFDCLRAVQYGYPAVALQGAMIFKKEYLKLFQNAERVYVCLDGDQAGIDGMKRIGSLLEDKARLVFLPDGKDLDEYLKENGRDKFQELLSSSLDPIEYEISLIPEDTKRIDLHKKLEPILQRISKRPRTQQEALLKEDIQKRFKLTSKEIDLYRREIKSVPKHENNVETQHAPDEEFKAVFPGLVDLVEYEGQPAYLIKEVKTFSIEKSVAIDGKVFFPPTKDQIPFLLPDGERVRAFIEDSKETDHLLYDDILEQFIRMFELPSNKHYDLLALWLMHTYLMEKFEYSPQLCFFATDTRGKSTTGQALIYMAYRGIYVENVREAFIFRMAEYFGTTIFFDIFDIWKDIKSSQSEDAFLQRFQRGAVVPRVINPELPPFEDIRFFKIFGPTIYATNEATHRVMEGRGIVINMPKTDRVFKEKPTKEGLLTYKERLVAFRARHLDDVLPDAESISLHRLGDILGPLHKILKLVCPEREQILLDLTKELEEERKMNKSQSQDARIIEAIINLESTVERGELSNKAITEKFNEELLEKFKLPPERIGRRIKALGIPTKRISGGRMAIIYDPTQIRALAEEHGVILPS